MVIFPRWPSGDDPPPSARTSTPRYYLARPRSSSPETWLAEAPPVQKQTAPLRVILEVVPVGTALFGAAAGGRLSPAYLAAWSAPPRWAWQFPSSGSSCRPSARPAALSCPLCSTSWSMSVFCAVAVMNAGAPLQRRHPPPHAGGRRRHRLARSGHRGSRTPERLS